MWCTAHSTAALPPPSSSAIPAVLQEVDVEARRAAGLPVSPIHGSNPWPQVRQAASGHTSCSHRCAITVIVRLVASCCCRWSMHVPAACLVPGYCQHS
jgi:hypothetical protein